MGQFDFRKIQVGQETVGCGTLAAATAVLLGELSVERRSSLVRRAPVSILANYGRQFLSQQLVGLKYTGDLTVEQVMYLLHMGIDGTVLGVGVGPTVWTYIKATTAEPVLQCMSIEYGDNTGASVVNGVVAERLEFSGVLGGGEPMIMTGDLFGWTKAPQAFTGGLAEPAVTPVPANFSRVWIDNTWAGLGGSEWTSEVLAWKLTLPCAYPVWRGTNLYPAGYGIESTHATLELKVEHTANTIAEIAGVELGTQRFVRIQAVPALNCLIQFDMCVTWDPETCYDADRGDNLVNLVGQSQYDDTVGALTELQIIVNNAVVLLP